MCLLISRKSTINLSPDVALKKYCDFKSYFVLQLLQAEKIIKNSKPLVVKEKKKKRKNHVVIISLNGLSLTEQHTKCTRGIIS